MKERNDSFTELIMDIVDLYLFLFSFEKIRLLVNETITPQDCVLKCDDD